MNFGDRIVILLHGGMDFLASVLTDGWCFVVMVELFNV